MHAVRREAGKLVGIDWGVERLATLSTGETIANPRFGAEAATGIGKAQRKLARAESGKPWGIWRGSVASSPTVARPICIS